MSSMIYEAHVKSEHLKQSVMVIYLAGLRTSTMKLLMVTWNLVKGKGASHPEKSNKPNKQIGRIIRAFDSTVI